MVLKNPCTKNGVCEKGTFCLFCANIVGSGLVGCCVVVVGAFVDADVINSMREVHNIFSHLVKILQFAGNFMWLFSAAKH